MPTVDDLLRADASCAAESAVVFRHLCEETVAASDLALRLYEIARRCAATEKAIAASVGKLSEFAEVLGVPADALTVMAKQDAAPGEDPRIAEARQVWSGFWAGRAVQALLELCARYFRYAITDLRRFRLTASNGYLRLEVESLALMALFRTRFDFAHAWLDPHSDQRKLFHKMQPQVKKWLREHDFTVTYDIGSWVSQHVALASARTGIRIGDATVEVLDQEFDPTEPASFHLGIAYFLRIQKRIFELLPVVFEELVADEEFQSALHDYRTVEDKVWWVHERKYAGAMRPFYAVAKRVPSATGDHRG
jgi:hypothetical protein